MIEDIKNIIYHAECIDNDGFSNYKIVKEIIRLCESVLKNLKK